MPRWMTTGTRTPLDPVSVFNPPGAQPHRGRGNDGSIGIGVAGPSAINNRPSGIEQRPPFSIGLGDTRGVICAVCASDNVDRSVGLAFVNIPIAEAVITTVMDTQFYPRSIQKIQMMEASCILMQSIPESAAQSGLALRPHIEEELVGVPIVETAKANWSAGDGMHDIQRVAFKEDLPCLEFAAIDNNYMLCAFSAAMKYLKDDFGLDFDDHSVRIKFQPPADVMMISLSTIRSLELTQNSNNMHSKDSLYGFLNRTTTPMGARILRGNILQPSTQSAVLNLRYEAVGELVCTDGLIDKVLESLQKLKLLGDVEQLLTKLVILPKDGSVYESEQAINNILKLKAFLTAIPQVFESLTDANCHLLQEIRRNCEPERADGIIAIISDTIDQNASYATKPLELRNQRVHTVKHEISANLDIQRKLYEDFSAKIHDYVNELEDEIRAKITLKYTAARKFYLQVQARDFGAQGLPAVLINRNNTKGVVECQTVKLVSYNERINETVQQAMIESDEVIRGLLSKIRPQISTLFKYCESIALVDLLTSFALITRSFAYTRPIMQGDSYALVGGRHPILDSRGLHKCIPNDYFVTEESRFQIITGQNMSGKSTYIRAIAMLQIMAQIGCYIPAASARMPVLYNLFARVSTDDTLELNLSTFSIEMREMAFILRNVNNKSLVIVDELGRATSTRDGLAIAAAMSEALLQSNATVFFATHFADLAKGFASNIGVVNRHLQTVTRYVEGQTEVPVMKMMYRVTEGAETEVSYGIALAKAIGFPPTFIAHAEKVAAELRARAKASKRDRQAMEEAKRRKLVANLVRQLKLAHESDAGDEELWQYLKQIHDDFWDKMLSSSEENKEEGKEDEEEEDHAEEVNLGEGEVEESVANVLRGFADASEEKYAVKSAGSFLFGDDMDEDLGELYSGGSAADAIMIDDDDDEDGDTNDYDYNEELH
ncbi:MutS protein msh4 [Sporothrix eucalyptigena]|uniref:MutS protein msh4 n=1 Tax=Sporothrix eucalyptigena TaxID=1812306 RepID=A0ABP0CRI5_9PEZI